MATGFRTTPSSKRTRSQVSPMLFEENKTSRRDKTPPPQGSVSDESDIPDLDISQIKLSDDAPKWAKVMLETVTLVITRSHTKLSHQITNSITLSGENSIEITQIHEDNRLLQARVDYLEDKYEQVQNKLVYQEVERRKDNILVHGLDEPAWESKQQAEQTVRDYISGSLGVDDSTIALRNIYRVGKRGQNHKRPILLNFQSSDDRQRVWKAKLRPPNATDVSGDNPSSNEDNRENRKSSGVFMTQDYPVEIQSRRRRLIPIFKKAKSMEDYRNDTYIHHDKLTIKGVTYTVNNIHTLPRELNPVMLSTRRDGDTIFFWSANSPFSNHHPCVFVCDDVRYNCSEQYYMHQMAIKANDTQRANAIMEADDPVTQKHIARDVVKPKEWIKLAPAVMMNGLRAKFLQNPTLSDYLTKTKDYQLAEASPYDTYWGIGLSFDSPVKSDAQNWKGKNQLGRLLVDLREEILKPTET